MDFRVFRFRQIASPENAGPGSGEQDGGRDGIGRPVYVEVRLQGQRNTPGRYEKSGLDFLPEASFFNIDQKADVISKTQVDALLSVFAKVFDEECGYYGKQPHIAQFERDLDSEGLLDAFKDKFRETSSKEWEWARPRGMRVAAEVDKAYNAVTGQSVSHILDKYRNDYRLSIEDFAEQVQALYSQQGTGF